MVHATKGDGNTAPRPAAQISFNDGAALRAVCNAFTRGLRKDQFRTEHDQYGRRWFVVPPADAYLSRSGREYRHAAVKSGGPEPTLAPLTEDQWRHLGLALDGVTDDTQSADELRSMCEQLRASDLWHGLIPAESLTGLFAPAKEGKSTLLRSLLRAGLEAGAASEALPDDTPEHKLSATMPFLGRAVVPFGALVVSEEPRDSWKDAPANCRVKFHHADPIRKPAEWERYVDALGKLAWSHNCDLVVIDSLSKVCGADENSAKAATRALAALRRLATDYHHTVLITHHLNRSGGVRGSTALEAQCDALLHLERVSDDITDPRRTLTSVSRLAPASRLEYAMQPDGTLAVARGDADKPAVIKANGPFRKAR